MADIFTYSNCFISVANTALIATKLTVEDSYESKKVNRFGDKTSKTLKGRRKQMVTAVFLQDFSAGAVHETLHAAKESANSVAIVVRPDGAAEANDNPQWTGTMVLCEYKPLDGTAGDPSGDVVAVFETDGTELVYSTGA